MVALDFLHEQVDGTFELKLCQACDTFLNADFDPCASSCCSDEVDEDDG